MIPVRQKGKALKHIPECVLDIKRKKVILFMSNRNNYWEQVIKLILKVSIGLALEISEHKEDIMFFRDRDIHPKNNQPRAQYTL